jgi:hypothetical protein
MTIKYMTDIMDMVGFSDITVIDDITDIAILRVIIYITVIKDLLISGPVPDPISFQIDPR